MKKLLSVIATALFAVVALAGCGSSTDTASSEKTVLKVGATAVPHAEILEQIKPEKKVLTYRLLNSMIMYSQT